jgi:hypothetical protein
MEIPGYEIKTVGRDSIACQQSFIRNQLATGSVSSVGPDFFFGGGGGKMTSLRSHQPK